MFCNGARDETWYAVLSITLERARFNLCDNAMTVFHRTSHSDAILKEGFRDSHGTYLSCGKEFGGIWVSDRPLDENEGAEGETLLAIEMPAPIFERYEWKEEGKTYREALVPAKLLNSLPRPTVLHC